MTREGTIIPGNGSALEALFSAAAGIPAGRNEGHTALASRCIKNRFGSSALHLFINSLNID